MYLRICMIINADLNWNILFVFKIKLCIFYFLKKKHELVADAPYLIVYT